MKKLVLLATSLLISLALNAQQWGIVNISVCNMRDTPKYSAEMVSQAILGTPVQILRTGGDYNWPEVRTPDGYTGWVHKDAITPMDPDDFQEWKAAPKLIVTSLYAIVHADTSAESPTVSDAVAGNRFVYLGKKGAFFKVQFPDGRIGFISKKDAMPEKEWRKSLDQSPQAVIKTAQSMLGFPYLWAGMSPKGTDCSGFVRTVLFMHDIIIPRDAGPQSQEGERIEKRDDLQPGDLVFFGRWKEDNSPSVGHVGFYLGDGRFIHSLGLVKIGSFRREDPLYDAYNTGRYLFGGRILPYIDTDPDLSTTLSNPFYAE